MDVKDGFQALPRGFMTKTIHVGQDPEQWNSLAIIPPITMSTNFQMQSPTEDKKYIYGRAGNPSRNVLEECLASLDNGKYALTFSSGLGATTSILGLLSAGDNVICGDDVYGGTNRLFSEITARFGVQPSFVDATKLVEVEAAIKPNTKMLWVESPTNPILKVVDIKKISAICKKHNVIMCVDNTFLTSYFQRPLELGADIVHYSLSKYMNGHSDVIMGAAITNNADLNARLRIIQRGMGIVPSPFDCSQVNRSLKTLALRMKQHNINGLAVGKFLEKHPKCVKLLHPGLPSHPQHDLFKTQCSGHSGMISFYIKGGMEEATKFLKALKIFTLAGSLGGFQSVAELPSKMSHHSVPQEERVHTGITDSLIRLSVGLEDLEDILSDLKQALECC